LIVVFPRSDSVLASEMGIPNHHTTKSSLVLMEVDDARSNAWRNIACIASIRRARKSDEDLGVAARGVSKMTDPSIEVVVRALALSVVVKLNEESIEFGLLNNILHLEMRVTQRAFRSCGD
jgi:hypothetical protein